ncbi:CMD domain protein [Xylophilus rhododendri]|uniref:CMD domain protein n=1 Tax=Xylophilus rhododendri TaxID=2697032 RepID=A0A857JC30_9BURK|nr:CMD domain protein [Xylophilus rhododendri]QHJ01228.1 CMD domain protein [Xylophilus rhododendri]
MTSPDIIDGVVPLAAGHPVHALRHERQKVVAATQASYEALFAPEVRDISVPERLMVALHASRLSRSDSLAAVYRARLVEEGAKAALIDAVDAGLPLPDNEERLATILAFTGKLITKPIDGDREAVEELTAVGLSTPAVVALGQLISFLSYQIRVVAGLKALVAATGDAA